MRIRIHTELDTKVAPALIREALLDFSERRLETWSETLDPAVYRVHWIEATSAEVTEGNRRPKVWSRERYDWSASDLITWTTQDSNFCAPGSSISMQITPAAGGGCRVGVTWDRIPIGVKGYALLLSVRIGGRRLLTWATKHALANIEAKLTDRTEE